jgi:hypothetical protein
VGERQSNHAQAEHLIICHCFAFRENDIEIIVSHSLCPLG